jgi:hypothetical protein
MPQNNFEINSTYPSQTPKSRSGGKLLITAFIVIVLLIAYSALRSGKTVEAPVEQAQVASTTESATPADNTSIDDLDASISAALQTSNDNADINAIQKEFK